MVRNFSFLYIPDLTLCVCVCVCVCVLLGHVAIEVVENCSCVSSNCYRADHFQSVSVLHGNRRREEVGYK